MKISLRFQSLKYNAYMESLKQRWQRLPVSVRKPIVLVVGLIFVIASPFTGVLPGPGGIPVFLIGIAILATEYEWARRVRDPIVKQVHKAGYAWRHHKVVGTLVILVVAALFLSLSFMTYRYIKSS
jgi:hypothetical protein